MIGHPDLRFSLRGSHSLTLASPPFFFFFFSFAIQYAPYQMIPLFNNSQPILDNLSPNDPFFDPPFLNDPIICWNFIFFFQDLFPKMWRKLYIVRQICQNLYNLDCLTPFLCSLWVTLFVEKSV